MGRRRLPLFQALEPAQLSSGLQPDMHPLLSLLWEAAANVQFANGRVKRRLPASLIRDNINGVYAVRGLSQQQATDGVRWLWGSVLNRVFRWYGPAHEVIHDVNLADFEQDETSISPASFFDFTHYGDWTIINVSPTTTIAPQVFKPGTGLETFGNAPIGAVVLLKKLSFVMAFGYGTRGTRIGWSDAGDIEEWTAAADNLAGSLTIDEFNTRIKAAAHLGTSVAVYAEDQMALVNYIGGNAVFGFKFALDGIGACGKFSVAAAGNTHFGVGRGGVWQTDGLSYRYIDEGFLHDYLQDNVNWAQQSKIVACRNDYTGCVDFAFPMLGSGGLEPTEGWSYDPRTGGWSPIPAFTLKDERRLFEKPILGTTTGAVMRDQDDATGVAPLTLRTKPLLLQAEGGLPLHIATRIDAVVLLLRGPAALEFRVQSAHFAGGPYTIGPWIAVTGSADTYDLGPEVPDGVYWKLEFRSTANNWALNLQGFQLYGTIEGTKRDAA